MTKNAIDTYNYAQVEGGLGGGKNLELPRIEEDEYSDQELLTRKLTNQIDLILKRIKILQAPSEINQLMTLVGNFER